jgi:hypothetical protein
MDVIVFKATISCFLRPAVANTKVSNALSREVRHDEIFRNYLRMRDYVKTLDDVILDL